MYPYTQNTGNLIDLIKSIGKHGIPDKFTTKELPVWGYKSSNDRTIVHVLKFIQFLDSSGSPTELWKLARTEPQRAVASGVRSGYQALFQTFPDAERKDSESLTNFFKAKTSVGDATIKMMVGTFKSLAQYGDFADSFEEPSAPGLQPANQDSRPVAAAVPGPISTTIPGPNGMTVNLNVELSLPADATGDVYDAFFKAMKKHLLGNG